MYKKINIKKIIINIYLILILLIVAEKTKILYNNLNLQKENL